MALHRAKSAPSEASALSDVLSRCFVLLELLGRQVALPIRRTAPFVRREPMPRSRDLPTVSHARRGGTKLQKVERGATSATGGPPLGLAARPASRAANAGRRRRLRSPLERSLPTTSLGRHTALTARMGSWCVKWMRDCMDACYARVCGWRKSVCALARVCVHRGMYVHMEGTFTWRRMSLRGAYVQTEACVRESTCTNLLRTEVLFAIRL